MRRPRRLLGAVAASAALGLAATVGLVVAGPARADLSATLVTSDLADMLVDGVHRQVFVASGRSTEGIEVRGYDGSLKGVVPTVGATGIALSADGSTVYAALPAAGAVARVSTSTLTETGRWTFGANVCPASVAVAAGKVWVGWGCDHPPRVSAVDLTGASPALAPSVVPADVATTALYGGPVLTAGGDVVLASSAQVAPAFGVRVDLSTSPPTVTSVVDNSCMHAVVPAGAPAVVTACLKGQERRASDLAVTHTYPTAQYTRSAATYGSSWVAFAGEDPAASYAYVFRRNGTSPTRRILLSNRNLFSPVRRGLAFAPDGSKLFVVTKHQNTPFELRMQVYDNPLLSSSNLTLTAPASATRAARITLTGTLTATPAFAAGRTVTVTRTDLTGTHSLPPVTTSGSGAFSVTDTPTVGGTVTYTASYAGDTTHRPGSASATVAVSRATPALTLTTDLAQYGYNRPATVTAHLGPTFDGRTVTVWMKPYREPKVLLGTGTVDAAGNLRLVHRLVRKTTFTVVYDGDQRYAPRAVTRTVTVRAGVTETVKKAYGASGKYSLFRTSVDPVLAVKISPHQEGGCVGFFAQRYSNGAWRTWATSDCELWADSGATARLLGSHPTGYRFRMRARWPGNPSNAAAYGPWKYFRFTS